MDRTASVIALLEAERPIAQLEAQLRAYPWDSDRELASLTPRHIQRVLTKFLEGTFSSADVEAWANAIECRDDVAVPFGSVQDALHELANPILTYPLTKARAQHWLSELRA